MLKVNFRGTIFEIEKNILLTIPYFNNIYKDCENNGEIYVNRSPYSFDAIINYITDVKYKISEEYVYDLDFYDIIIDEKRINRLSKNIDDVLSSQETINSILINHSNEIQKLNDKIDKIISGVKDVNLYQINIKNTKDYYHRCSVCEWNTKHFIHGECRDKYKECNIKDCKNINVFNGKYCQTHTKSGNYCNVLTCINRNMNKTGLCFLHS